MLDTNAEQLHEFEVPEILSKAPDMKDKDVLELAAGIGRFTGYIAAQAKSVIAVEFMETFHQANLSKHNHYRNIQFLCRDVVQLQLPENSLDVIFSNWLFMYLSDDEVRAFASKAIRWLRPGGTLFFRESCFRQSGNVKRNANPTQYRHPSFYVKAFGSVFSTESNNTKIGHFYLKRSCSVSAYRTIKQNNGQVCFYYSKVMKAAGNNAMHTFQTFLDEQQYSIQSIKRYEKIFGKGYVSTGGQGTTTEFVERLQLKPQERVLDVGCGIGGGDFYMAREYGVSVLGIDLSTNMVHRALEQSMKETKLDVEFEICDATTREFPDQSFDVIYSRDTILHIQDKKTLFERFFRWLRPGGRVLITDYCRGGKRPTNRFADYVQGRGYHLLTVDAYGALLTEAGFCNVSAEDRTSQFMSILREELDRTVSSKDEFIQDTSKDDFNAIVKGWEAKLIRCEEGDQKWGFFYAEKQ